MRIKGERSPGSWFFARNSGRNLSEIVPSGEWEMSSFRPERLEISETLLPEARAMRKAVLYERAVRESSLLDLKGLLFR